MVFTRTSRYLARCLSQGKSTLESRCNILASRGVWNLHSVTRSVHADRHVVIKGSTIPQSLHPRHDGPCLMGRRNMTSSAANLDDTGKTCTVTWEDGFSSTFHSVWLRHNCQCGQCRHGNGQLLINPVSIPHDVRLRSAYLQDGHVTLTWTGANEADHQGRLSMDYLRQHNYNEDTLDAFRRAVKMDTGVKEIPTIQYEAIRDSKHDRFRWLKQINEAGLSIVKNVPLEDGMVKKVGEMIAPVWESIYGTVFDVVSTPDPINVAYSTVHLDYHMDLVYFESPPGLQLLHCIKFDECVEGGHSTFFDIYTHAEEFRIKHPDHFHTLTTVPATFQKVHYEREFPVHLVNQKPHIKLNHHGDIVAVYWAPAFEGPLAVAAEDVEKYYAAYEVFAKEMASSPHQLTHKLVPGDLMVFNNIRMLHGRTDFDLRGGERNLQGAYVNIDFFKSQVQVMSTQLGDGAPPKRVGNQCWR